MDRTDRHPANQLADVYRIPMIGSAYVTRRKRPVKSICTTRATRSSPALRGHRFSQAAQCAAAPGQISAARDAAQGSETAAKYLTTRQPWRRWVTLSAHLLSQSSVNGLTIVCL